MLNWVAKFRQLLDLPKELEGLKKELDSIKSDLGNYEYIVGTLADQTGDLQKAFKLLTEEQGVGYKELRTDLNTFIELYTSLESRLGTCESLLPEILSSKTLSPVNTYHSFRTRRRELESKKSTKIVDETKPALVAQG